MSKPLIELRNLNVSFHGLNVVKDLSLTLTQGEILGLVGESGSGKSVTARSLLRLDEATGATVTGTLAFGEFPNLLDLSEPELRSLRGNRMAMVLQDPMTSLNPVHRIGDQVAEVFRLHRGLRKREARIEAINMLKAVDLPEPARSARKYPHELSGGQRQRIGIAMALACEPDVLIADEPTTALDGTTQTTILDLLRRLRSEKDTTILFITHDLGVVSELCDRVAVLYGGRLVETGRTADVLSAPAHPYTRALLASVPRPNQAELSPIPGEPPAPGDRPPGCPFAPRCPLTVSQCETMPEMESRPGENHHSACWQEGKGIS
jgi:oligopeptide/dipeptide ABC transporter ATP-binding protein